MAKGSLKFNRVKRRLIKAAWKLLGLLKEVAGTSGDF